MLGFAGIIIVIFYSGELRMKPDEKKAKENSDDFSPVLPLMLVGSMILALIVLVLKLIGLF
jgi:hypothetical protein